MATASRRSDIDLEADALETRLHDEAFTFEFFQAVRLLEALAENCAPVGGFAHPAREAVRFAVHQTLSFPASQVQSIEASEDKPARMVVNFMGLTGPEAVLPHPYTELLIQRLEKKDRSAADFLNIFNHRIISLFYRAWRKYRFSAADASGEGDSFSDYLRAFVGLLTPALQNRQDVPDGALLYYAGLLAQKPHSATALKQLLSDYFGVEAEIEQFIGGWSRLEPGTETALDDDDPNPAAQLGMGAVVGDEIWCEQSRARVRLGPLTMRQYLEFLPNGAAYPALKSLLKFFTDTIDFEVQLVLHRDEVPSFELDSSGYDAVQLGWVSWMKNSPMQRDPGETILRV